MATRRAWVLNLDADLELAALDSAYTPTESVLGAMRLWRAHLAPLLLHPGDVLVDEASAPGCAQGLPGRAFCPTPRALALLARAGAIAEPHPPAEVLRRVNSREFSAALGPTLPGGVFVSSLADASAVLSSAPPAGFSAWRVKRAFGMAGRGQRVIVPGPLSAADEAFVRGSLGRDGVRIEPNASIELEVSLHGVIDAEGNTRLGAIVRQRCDARGVWISSERLEEAFPFARALEAEAARAGAALWTAGYFGPFGVDAFTHAPGAFNPRSEINARYSMGFPLGFAHDG